MEVTWPTLLQFTRLQYFPVISVYSFVQTWPFFGIEGLQLQRKHLILVFNILCDMMVASNHKYQGSEPSQAVEEATVGLARFLIPSYQPWCSYYHKQ